MCRWGCTTVDTTYMCKWCGTRYCQACLKGDFTGIMKSSDNCRKCFQKKCQGQRVEFRPRPPADPSEKRPKSKKAKSSSKKKKTKGKKKLGKKKR